MRIVRSLQAPYSTNIFFDCENLYPKPTLIKNEPTENKISEKKYDRRKGGHDSDESSNSWPEKVLRLTQNKPSLGGSTMSSSKKIVLVGDQAVGKTTLARKYSRGTLDTNYKATIGIDFECIKYNILGIPFTIQLWDTAGQERFRAMSSQYYRKAKVVLIVADATNSKSIANVEMWNEHVDSSIDGVEGCFKFLVLTKIDLISGPLKSQIYENVIKIAQKIDAEFWPCSSTINENVDEIFNRAVSLIFLQNCYEEITETENVLTFGTLGPNGTLKNVTEKRRTEKSKHTTFSSEKKSKDAEKYKPTGSSEPYQNYDPRKEPGHYSPSSNRRLVGLTQSDIVSLTNSPTRQNQNSFSDKASDLIKTWFNCGI